MVSQHEFCEHYTISIVCASGSEPKAAATKLYLGQSDLRQHYYTLSGDLFYRRLSLFEFHSIISKQNPAYTLACTTPT
jgi:hypothetical protein